MTPATEDRRDRWARRLTGKNTASGQDVNSTNIITTKEASTPASKAADERSSPALRALDFPRPSGPPPEYWGLRPSEEDMDRVEREWEPPSPDPGDPDVTVMYVPDPVCSPWRRWLRKLLRKPTDAEPEWVAVVLFWTSNVPRLMREGLHWTPGDAVLGQGVALISEGSGDYEDDGDHVLCRMIQERPDGPGPGAAARAASGQEPLWKGLVLFMALDRLRGLRGVDMHKLEDRMIHRVEAYDAHGDAVYFADRASGVCANMIYPGMRLEGAWQWPEGLKAKKWPGGWKIPPILVTKEEVRRRKEEDKEKKGESM